MDLDGDALLMSGWSSAISLDWGDNTYTFRLNWKQIEELEERTGLGCQALLESIANGTHKDTHLWHAIRLGLIGGGMKEEKALDLCRRYVAGRPLQESIAPAFQIINAAWRTPDGDPVPKPEAAENPSGSTGLTEGSPSPP